MNVLSLIHLGAVVVSFTLGILVLRTNPRRTTNQVFSILSFDLAIWLICMALAFSAPNSALATAFIRGCHSLGITFPFLFDSLRQSIASPGSSLWSVIRKSPVWLATTLGMAALSLTPWIVEGSYISHQSGLIVSIPEPIIGQLFGLYVGHYAAAMGILMRRFWVSPRHAVGIQRAELHFVILGALGSVVTGSALAIIPPLITGSSQSARFTSLGVIVLDSVIAYGIATRRIMDMAYLFRLLTSYGLLISYLGLLYALVFFPAHFLVQHFGLPLGPLPHFLAALAVAFSLAPMNGSMQRFANRVFIHDAPLNMESVVQLANRLLRSISTVDHLLADFADTITKAVGTDRIIILLAKDHQYVQRYQSHGTFPQLAFAQHDVLPQALIETATAIVPDILRRLRPSVRLAEACTVIEQHKLSIAIGLRAKEGLEGILLLGPKLSGRIYGAPEQHALQLLCNQLAIALNNARLYTQVQDAKIYNDMLVDNLASGVIAADSAGMVTVFNREAQRITQRDTASILGQPSTVLPDMLAALLSSTLTQAQGQRDQDMVLARPSNGEGTPIRVSSSVFFSHTGEILGAFLVINDLTTIKQLELQVRRTDRLASLGTLAAGMAHEIKNPLVSIKTFTQLLPERYEDDDFRQTFFSLVGGEVKRIDRIVNQLLRFSRPAKPNLTATRLHEVIDSALKLMTQQLRQKNISLTLSLDASSDSIRADGDQLSQALINLFLNAIEAMTDGGRLTVRTKGVNPNGFSNAFTSERLVPPQIEVTIQDTGEGIPAEAITHIFDPFFTTKDQGTGLGLSVAHGIVHEHNGIIDAKSEPGQGTTFTILLPLLQEDKPS
jgi:two-component system nitrogen regulation sensor histidine kinase GlnL